MTIIYHPIRLCLPPLQGRRTFSSLQFPDFSLVVQIACAAGKESGIFAIEWEYLNHLKPAGQG